jgi:hypothetical protein
MAELTNCPDCGAQLEFKGVSTMRVWHEVDGWKVYDARCSQCGKTMEVVGERAGPADGYPRGNKPKPKLNGEKDEPKSVPKARAKHQMIVVPLRTWLAVSEDKHALLTLLGAAEAAKQWFHDVYPPDSFDGSSGDSGAVSVVKLRDDLLEAISDVDRSEVPVGITVRGPRSCSQTCPWHRRYMGHYREQEATCVLFDAWLGLVGSRPDRPMARCQACAKARVIGEQK